MRTANRFTNPATGFAYDWPVNHDEEDSFGKERAITEAAPTAHGNVPGVGLIRQQGDEAGMRLKLSGSILDPDQLRMMWAFFEATRVNSIFFRDFAGDEYEVLITAYKAPRTRVARNPRDPAHPWIWHYTLTMEVVTIRAGVYAQAGVTV